MSERAPITIAIEDWPCIASATRHDGQVRCQANNEWEIEVRQHADGRVIVSGSHERGDGGQHAGFRATYAGYVLGSRNTPIANATDVTQDDIIRSIRRVAGAIGDAKLGDECIGDLPAEEIDP